jgi:FAD dependent oxidoreductase TIGR03364
MTQDLPYDDAVIGAGILGLAHAYQLARRGRRVIVFERHPRALGASVRNFGMLWPIGQPFGPLRSMANRSLEHWLEILTSSAMWHERSGSLHLAYRDDEADVLREFAHECDHHDEAVDLLQPREVRDRAPAVKREGLQLALWSRREVCVDPREVVGGLPQWLSHHFGVVFHFASTVTEVQMPEIHAGRRSWSASRLWICSGDELGLLFGEQLQESGLLRCKLQMMRSYSYGDQARIGPMLAAGLTLRHYDSFRNCPSLAALKNRIAHETPWLDRFGIHVLIAQNGRGELTIGDSHEYDDAIEPFDKNEIDEWILGYLKTFLEVPGLRIASRWHGTYAKHPERPYVIIHPAPRATAVTGVGGAGMTLSFGLAEQVVARELGEAEA